jgi:RimJ/RimL family protein N-acetyltransferase
MLRRWLPGDAAVLHEVITRNVDHLRPWMVWIAREPGTLGDREALLSSWSDSWNDRGDFAYAILHDESVVGSAGLHLRQGRGVFDIGYWVDVNHLGRGLATRVARILADEALTHDDVHAVEIHHDVYNVASGRVAEKAGFTAVADYEREPEGPGGCGVFRRWVRVR